MKLNKIDLFKEINNDFMQKYNADYVRMENLKVYNINCINIKLR